MQLFAVIPAYEPDDKMLPLLQAVSEAGMQAYVVDDGSGSSYDAVFEEAKKFATVLRYDTNHGKGYALKYAFNALKEREEGQFVLVTMDCDGQHSITDAQRLCAYAEEHPGELVLGSRRQGKKSPLRSRLGNGITRNVFAFAAKKKIYDTQTGLRSCTSDLLPFLLEIPGERYEYEMNMLMMGAKQDIGITELPIETIYFDDNKGSHFNAVKDSFRIYKEILKFGSSSFVSFLVDYAIYSILVLCFPSVEVLIFNVIARVISASLNFALNRNMVFTKKEKMSVWSSLWRYALLAACILAANSGIVYGLVDCLGWNKFVGKLLAEIVLFIVSWLVQRNFVYYRRNKS